MDQSLECHLECWARVDLTYPIYQSDFIEVNPVRHKLVAERYEGTFVAKHELFGSHFDDWLTVGLSNNQIDGQSEEVVPFRGNVGDTLSERKKKIGD